MNPDNPNFRRYTDIMLDLETLGTSNNAAIVQIGAVAFNADGENASLFTNSPDLLRNFGQGFRMNVDLAQSKSPGVYDQGAINFWLGQSDEARASITAPGVPLGEALRAFAGWVEHVSNGRHKVRLWSNGPTFDETILRAAFDRYGLELPVSFRGSRCCRTMMENAESFGGYNRREAARAAFSGGELVQHDGLADSVFQARGVITQRLALRIGARAAANMAGTSSGPGEVS